MEGEIWVLDHVGFVPTAAAPQQKEMEPSNKRKGGSGLRTDPSRPLPGLHPKEAMVQRAPIDQICPAHCPNGVSAQVAIWPGSSGTRWAVKANFYFPSLGNEDFVAPSSSTTSGPSGRATGTVRPCYPGCTHDNGPGNLLEKSHTDPLAVFFHQNGETVPLKEAKNQGTPQAQCTPFLLLHDHAGIRLLLGPGQRAAQPLHEAVAQGLQITPAGWRWDGREKEACPLVRSAHRGNGEGEHGFAAALAQDLLATEAAC